MKTENRTTDQGNEEAEAFITPEEANAAVHNYSRALEKRLKPTLAATFSLRHKALKELAELEQTDRALHLVEKECRSSRAKPGKPAFESRVNLGENFFVRAEAKRAEKVVLDLGLGVFVEVGFREASKFVQERRQMFRNIADTETKKVAEIQAMVEGVVKCLSGLQVHDGTEKDRQYDQNRPEA